jgi:phage terminase small subunit
MKTPRGRPAQTRTHGRAKPVERVLGDDQVEILPAWQTHDWTVEEVKFASAFLRTGNRSAAWREVYSESSPAYCHIGASKLLAHPWMAGYIAYCNDAIRQQLMLTKENVLEELARLGFANFSDFVVLQEDGSPQFDLSGLSRDQMASIAEMTIDTYVIGKNEPANEGREVRSVKVKLAPKLGALEALGKHLKLFTDVIEHNVSDVADEIRRAREARQERLAKQKELPDGSE